MQHYKILEKLAKQPHYLYKCSTFVRAAEQKNLKGLNFEIFYGKELLKQEHLCLLIHLTNFLVAIYVRRGKQNKITSRKAGYFL